LPYKLLRCSSHLSLSLTPLPPSLPPPQKVLKRAAILPAISFCYASVFIKETKDSVILDRARRSQESSGSSSSSSSSTITTARPPPLPTSKEGNLAFPILPVRLLVLNGFLLMYAFSVETVYAMFIKVRGEGGREGGNEEWKRKG